MKIRKKHARLEIRKNSFTHRVVSPWNKLPDQAVCAKSVNEFKSAVDAALSSWYDTYSYGLSPEWHQIVSL